MKSAPITAALTLLLMVLQSASFAAAPSRLVLAPSNFTQLQGARLVEADGAPGGRAILIEQVGGHAAARLRIGPREALPAGLYRVSVLLGSRDGTLRWATVQTLPQWQWFAAVVDGQSTGKPAWQTTEHLLILDRPGEMMLEVRSKGDRDFYIGQVTLEETDPFWPKEMMSDAEFFGALDRRQPGLKATIEAADAGDYERACHELVAYFRAAPRHAPSPWGGAWWSQPPKQTAARVPEAADLALEDKLRLAWQPSQQHGYCTSEQHRIPPTVFSFATPQQWHGLYEYPGRRWYGWFLSPCLNDLTRAYEASGDARYARKAMQLVGRFIEEWGPLPKTRYSGAHFPNPYYTKASFGLTPTAHGWSQSSGIRDGLIEAVWRTLQVTAACPEITDRQRIEALKLCLILARFVYHRADQTNGVPSTCLWLVKLVRWLPEFPEVTAMSRRALFRAASFMDDCHFPDGAYFELCYYRHAQWCQIAQQAAAQGLDTGPYLARLRPTFDLNLYLTHPMGNFPWINDEGGGTIVDPPQPQRPAIAALGLQLYPDDPLFQYAASFGEKGVAPKESSKNFPWCGFMMMRTGWRPDDLHLVFDGCRNTGSHNHQDQMNIVLAAYGSTLLTDNGYVGTGFSAPDRLHYINHPRGHNLLTFDDLMQTPDTPKGENLIGWRAWGNTPRNNYWLSATGYDYAETRYDRPYINRTVKPPRTSEAARQQRRILFLKPSTGLPYWVVYDLVEPKKQASRHKLQLLFHAAPTGSAKLMETPWGARITAEKAGLLILPRSDKSWSASIVRGDARPDQLYWQGFVSGGYAKPLVPTDCAIFEHNGSLPAAVATVLFPYPKNRAQDAEVQLLPVSREGSPLATDCACGLAVRTPQGRDVILALAEPGALTHFGEFAFDGRLAVVRHDATGKITSVAMMDGSALHCGKQPLLDIGGRRIHYVECAPRPGVSPAGVTVAENLRVTDLRWPEEPK